MKSRKIETDHICDYGCGQIANFIFVNGKYCCENHISMCPKMKEKKSKATKGRILSEEHKRKIGLGNKGKKRTEEEKRRISEVHSGKIISEEHRQKIIFANKIKRHSEETKKKISMSNMGKKASEEHKEKIRNALTGRKLSEDHIQTLRISFKRPIEYWIEFYPTFSKEEEMRYNPDKPGEKEIQVHCKNHNCPNSKENGGWFTPSRNQFNSRIFALEHPNGNDAQYFYCSDECKYNCPLFNKSIITLIKQIENDHQKIYYTTEDYNTWRQEVLKRANNECQYCGKPAEHCHHIQPQKLDPIYVLDPDNGIACCEECHYKYGHETGTECSTGNLANKICL